MNATWILGNGFDLNLGLKTGYPDFRERRYDRLRDALTAIAEADVIASFGCSFGPTDEHLWRAVGERMRTAPATCFVCFDRSLPEKGEDAREYLRKSTALKNQLASALGLPKSDSVLARIITVPSSRVFRFAGESAAVLKLDPYEVEEGKN